LLVELLDGGQVRRAALLSSRRYDFGRCLKRLPCQRGQRVPHPSEAFPTAARELLPYRQYRAMDLLRLATWRFNIRTTDVTPLNCPATIQKSQVLGFRSVAQDLETLASRPAFVARSDSLLAHLRRLAWAETNRVISPQIRQRHRISRQRGGNVLLAELL